MQDVRSTIEGNEFGKSLQGIARNEIGDDEVLIRLETQELGKQNEQQSKSGLRAVFFCPLLVYNML